MGKGRALLAAFCLVPTLGAAQTLQGPYVAGGIGANFIQETDLNPDSQTRLGLRLGNLGTGGNLAFNPGFAGVMSFGWGFGNGLRAEVEGSWRSNSLDTLSGYGALGHASGSQDTYGVMANVLLDLRAIGPVVPYIGVGAGYMVTNWRAIRANMVGGALRFTGDDSDGRFAYQGIAGLAFPLGFAPGLALTAEYRFLGTLQPQLQARFDNPTTGATVATGTVGPENYNHSLMLGLRFAFNQGAAPPPAAPAAAPEPTRTFLVFFDWDRAELTDRARQIVGQAAATARGGRTTRIDVAGHADRSGTPQYNQALSQRRAEAVASELVRQGIQRSEITVTALGESRPLVPTADGVREPQNRRVEIVLR